MNCSKLIKRFLLLTCATLVGGCASYKDLPHGTVKEMGSAILEKETITVPPEPPEQTPSPDYVIGAGDVLYISVAGRPEFTTVAPGGASKVQGNRVDGTGNVHIPLAGAVPVVGLTVGQARTKIETALRTYLQNPAVVVEVAEFKSQPLYLIGQFRNPGTYYLDRPLTLIQGVALGNGFDATAYLRGARISRGKKIMKVDLSDLLLNGDARQNIWLRPGDMIYIPNNQNQQVFIFGAVKKPGPVPIPPAGLNLAQAVATAELRDIGPDSRHVRIIRSVSPTRGELLVVDFEKILRAEVLPLQLQEGDIVFVPKSSIGNWNDAIGEILPSLQAISALLQPFVNIKFLSK